MTYGKELEKYYLFDRCDTIITLNLHLEFGKFGHMFTLSSAEFGELVEELSSDIFIVRRDVTVLIEVLIGDEFNGTCESIAWFA
jgi:hypothetical protein